jgi:peptidoglycan/xylan/chitin deacetylase (PgdA/CDA1 family)
MAGGFRAAVALTFDVDAEPVMQAGDPWLAAWASLMSHQRYGPQAGLPRILRRLAGRGIRATFFVPGYTTDRTLDLLVEYGFRFDSSLFDAGLPYVRQLAGGSIAEIPASWALDDWEKYAFWPGVTGTGTIERPSLVAEHWWEEVLAYTQEGACCVITMHPFLSGRPAHARALGSLIDKIIQHGEIWLAPMGEIADRVMAATAATPGPGCAKMPPGQNGRSS